FLDATAQKRVNDFLGYMPISDATAEAFGNGERPGPQGDDLHRFYFGNGWRLHPWNDAVVANIAIKVLGDSAVDTLPSLTAKEVQAAVWDLARQAQVSWKGNKPRPVIDTNGEERMEDESEAEVRNLEQTLHRKQRTRINARKSDKYKTRKRGIAELLNATSEDRVAHRKWRMVQEINDALGNEGQSSEESDREPSRRLPNHAFPLRVTRPHYRHPIAGELLNDLDNSVDKLRETSDHRHVQHRLRRRTTDLSMNSVNKGLPKALYDPLYLRSLTPLKRKQLKPSDTAIPRFSAYVSQVESERMHI
ncbi:hypothetical protein DFJ43DRAFT_992000, partial [Lentinula guzmanii]